MKVGRAGADDLENELIFSVAPACQWKVKAGLQSAPTVQE